jgi:hypothetical protein
VLRPIHRRLIYLTTAFALSLLSCGREVTGPENGISFGRARMAALAVEPVMPELMTVLDGAGAVEPFERVRVVLRRTDGSIALDTIVPFPIGATEISLTLLIPIPVNSPAEGLPLSVSQSYINAAGDTVFRGGPTAVIARPVGSDGANMPVQVPVVWQGTGSDAARVTIAPKPASVFSGTTTTFTGTAFTASDAPIPGTPFLFFTLDSTRVQVNATTGVATWLPVRGTARIVGVLPNSLRADTATITVALPASKLVLGSGNAQTGVLNAPLTDSIVVRTLASDDVPVEGVIVTFAVATGGGSLTALVDTSDANGNVSTKWTLGAALGAQTITATAAGLTGSPLTLSATAIAGEPVALDITQEPSSGVAGIALAPALVVTARDAFGNVATGFTGSVTVAVADGQAPPLGGTLTRTATAGVATFDDLSIAQVGNWALAVTSGALIADTSSAIAIAHGAASVLSFVMEPTGAVAGEAFAPPVTVRASDAFGNVATSFSGNVTLTLADGGGATLRGTTTRAAVGGMATFEDLNIHEVGTGYRLEASSGALAAAASETFGIVPAAASQLLIVSGDAQDATLLSLLGDSLIVEARDQFGNVVPGATVNFAVLTGGGVPSAASGITGASGRTGIRWTLGSLLGEQTLQASLDAAPAVTVTFSATGTVGAPSQVVIVSAPSSGVAGSPLTVVAEVRDALGNVVPTYTSQLDIAFDANPAGATLFGTLTANAVAGVATFDAFDIQKAGSGYSLRVTTVGESIQSAPSTTFDIASAAATQLVVTQSPSGTVAAGTPFSVTVEARDAFGNQATEFNDAIAIAFDASPGGASFLSGGEAIDAADGVAFFDPLVLDLAGTYRLRFTSGALTAALTNDFSIGTAGAEAMVAAAGDEQSGTVGSTLPVDLMVVVTDSYGNPVPGVSVTWSVVSGGGAVGVPVTTDALGRASTTWTLGGIAGEQVARALAGFLPSVDFTATATAGAATQLVILEQPSAAVAGDAFAPSIVVEIRDAVGNRVTSWSDSVRVVVDSGPVGGAVIHPVLGDGAAWVTDGGGASSGVLSGFRIEVAGTYRLKATSDDGRTVLLAPFTVQPSAATQMTMVSGDAQSGSVASTLSAPLVVEVRDAFSNLIEGASVQWAVASGDANVTIGTVLTDENGQSLTELVLGTESGPVTVTATVAGLDPVQFTATILGGAPSYPDQLIAPVGGTAGTSLPAFAYAVYDAFGNIASGYSGEATVTLQKANGAQPDPIIISGDTVDVIAGVATWDAFIVGSAGQYRIVADFGPGLGTYVSAILTIGAADPSALVLVDGDGQTGEVGTVLPNPLRARVTDAFGNGVAGVTVNFNVVSGMAELSELTPVTDAGGYAQTFVTLDTLKGPVEIGAFAAGLTPPSLTYTLVAEAGPATDVWAVTGDGQSAQVGNAAANPVVVMVTDVYGNAVSGATVEFASSVPGDLSFSDTTVITDSDGLAQTTVIAGTGIGTRNFSASVSGVGSVGFTLDVTAGAAAALAVLDAIANTTAGEALPAFRVEIRDAFGNKVATAGDSIAIAIESGPGGAEIVGTAWLFAVNGEALFNDIVLQSAGTYMLRAAADGLVPATTNAFDVTAAAAHTMAVESGDGQSGAVDSYLANPLRVRVTDVYGNPVPGVEVAWELIEGVAFLNGDSTVVTDTSVTDAAGIAELAVLLGADAYTPIEISASVTGLVGSPVLFTATTNPDEAFELRVVGEPSSATAGTDLSPFDVQAIDEWGNIATGFNGQIIASVESGPGGIGGTTTVNAVNGIATFSQLSLETAGLYVLRFSASGLLDGVSDGIEILAATPAELVILDAIANTEAGETLTAFRVEIRDAFGNKVATATDSIAVEIESGPDGAPIYGTAWRYAVDGEALFDNLMLTTAGAYVLRATGVGLTSSSTNEFVVAAAAPAAVSIESGDNQTGGIGGTLANPLQVKVIDSYGNPVPGVAVAWEIEGGDASVSADTSLTGVDGVAEMTLLLGTSAGGVSILAVVEGVSGSPVALIATIAADAAVAFIGAVVPTPTDAGATITSFPVYAIDGFNNIATGFTGEVTATVDFGPGAISGTTTVNAVAGVATFTDLSFEVAGTYRLRYTSPGLTDLVSDYFEIVAGAPALLQLVSDRDGQSAPVTQSLPLPLAVTATDAFGNVVSGAMVVWTSLSAGVTLSVDTTYTDGAGLVEATATFGTTAANFGVVAELDGTSESVNFTMTAEADAPNFLNVDGSGVPAPTVAGATLSTIPVRVFDQYNNFTGNSAAQVTVSVYSGPTSLIDGTLSVTPVGGIASFDDLVLTEAGTYTLEFTHGLASSEQIVVEILPAAAAAVAVTGTPSSVVAGEPLTDVVIELRDAFGNHATDATDSVFVSIVSAPPDAEILGDTAFAAVGGSVTLTGAALNKAGNYVLEISGAGLTPAQTTEFTVTAAAAALIVLESGDAQSDSVTSYSDTLVVRLTDAFGNGVDGGSVTWDVPGDSAIIAYAESEADSEGYARAVVQFGTDAGPITVTADAGAISGSPVVFNLTITAGSPETVEMVSAPDTVQAPGTGDVFVVRVADAYGNTVESFTDVVEVTLNAFPDGASFSGTTTAAAVDGVATFDALAFDVAGLYTLYFASGSLSGIEHYLEVTAGGADSLFIVSGDEQTGYATLDLDEPLRVRIVDAFGNPVAGDTVRFIVLTGGGLVGGQAADTVITDGNGEAATTWTLGAATGEFEVQAAVTGLTPVNFTATVEALAGNIIWGGAVSWDWENPANWLGGVKPTATDSVWIRPGSPNQPTMTAPATIAGLTIDPWATLVIAEQVLTVNGKLIVPQQAWHTIDTGGDIVAAGSGTYPIAGQFPRLTIENGTYEVQGYVGVAGNGSFVEGDLDISSSGHIVLDGSDELAIAGSLTTASGGRFSQTAGTTISVTQGLQLAGEAAGTLSGGQLIVLGDISITGEGSIAADSAHVLKVGGGSQSLNIENASTNPLGSLLVDEFTTLDVVQAVTLRGDVTIAASSYVTAGSPSNADIGGVLTDPSGGRWGLESTTFTGTNAIATTEIPGWVYLRGPNTLTSGLTVGGSLYVRGTAGSLTLNGNAVSVSGVFYTMDSGYLVMDQSSDEFAVDGNAFFTGGNSVLTAGATTFNRRVEVYSGERLRASAPHVTTLSGSITDSLEFATPGFGAGQSHFGSLVLAKGEAQVALKTNVFVDGVLTATLGTQSVNTEGTGYGFTARGANISGAVFSAASLHIVDGEPISALENLSFTSGVSDQTMLTIERPGGSYTLDSPSFDYSAFNPTYVRLVDTDEGVDTLRVTVVDPTPEVHLGRIELEGAAQLLGWDAFGTFVWTGSVSNDWWEAANWNFGVVPMADADVLVPNETPDVTMVMPATIRSLTWESNYPFNLEGTLTVTGSLTSTVETAAIACVFDGKIVMTAQDGPAQLSGRYDCPLIHESGEVQVEAPVRVQSLTLEGGALFNPMNSYVRIDGDLHTSDNATLQMTESEVAVEVYGDATFASTPAAGSLTHGQLILHGDFTQETSATAFRATWGHGTVFAGSAQQVIRFANADTTAGGSHFGRIILSQEYDSGVLLDGEVFAVGALFANNDATLEGADGAQRLVTGGASVGEGSVLEMRNVQWVITNGDDLDATVYNVRFTQQDPGVTQASLVRASGSVSLNNWEFDTEAASTTYLSVADNTGSGDGIFAVTMVDPVPAFHSGLLVTDGVAEVNDWGEFPLFVWVSTSDTDWDNSANWLSGVVPSESDSVTIPAGAVANPALPGSRSIRALVNENSSVALTIGGEMVLTVTERLTLHPTGMGITCDGTSAVHLDGEDVKLSGRIGGCLLEGVGGKATLEGTLTVGWDLHLLNDHEFVLAGNEVDVDGNLWLDGTSVLRMEDPSDALSVLATVTWGGGAHVLTDGTLSIGSSFQQVGTGNLQASGNHTTVFFDSCTVDCGPVGLVIADDASTFANLVVSEGDRSGSGTITALNDITLAADAGLLSGGPVNTTRLEGTASSVLYATTLRIDGEYAHAGALNADTVEFSGTGQEIPSQVNETTVEWPVVVISGDVTAASDEGNSEDAVTIGGHLIIRDGGQFTVGRPGVPTNVLVYGFDEQRRNLFVASGGTLRMQQPNSSLHITGSADFSGGDHTGLLTDGTLLVESGFSGSGLNSFVANDAHRTILGGDGSLDFYTIASGGMFRFGTLELTNHGYLVNRSIIADTLVQGDVSSYLQTNSFLRTTITGDIFGGEDAVLTTPHLTLGGVFAHDGQQNVDTLVLSGSGQQLRMFSPQGFPLSYERVEVTGDVTTFVPPTETFTLKAVVVRESGNLRLGHEDQFVTITMDSLRTSGQGTIEMQDMATLVQVFGPAIFAGGSTAGKLMAGDIKFSGGFQQLSTNSTSSYQADGSHFSTFQLGASQVDVSFDDPGFGPTQSRFSQLVTQGSISGWIAVNSDIAVGRQFSTLTSTVTRFVAPEFTYHRLTSGGAAASYVEFDGIGWTIEGAWAITDTLSDITFKNQDPTAAQWRIARDGAQTTVVLRPSFDTEPTSGFYLQVEDEVLNDQQFTVAVAQPTPIVHNGFLEVLGEAIVTGWESDSVENVWTGSENNNWLDPLNWSLGVVPTAQTDVRIPNVLSKPEIETAGTYITRNLVVESGSYLDIGSYPIELRGDLTLDGSLYGYGYGSGGVVRMRPPGGTERNITVSPSAGLYADLDLDAPVSGADSVFRLQSRVEVDGNVRVASGRLALDGKTLEIYGSLTVEDQGRVSMLASEDSLIVIDDAIFAGPSTEGLLTAGTMRLYGKFRQLATVSPASFLASGTHRTVLSYADSVVFASGGFGGDSSRFATLQIRDGSGTTALGSDVHVDGQLIAVGSRIVESTNGNTMRVRGTGIAGIQFAGVPLEVLDGAPVDSLRQAYFIGMDPAVTQLSISRSSGAISLSTISFTALTVPDPGKYLVVTDTDEFDGQPLTVALSSMNPLAHGGFLGVLGGAEVTGWNEFEFHEFLGTESGDFDEADNWSTGVVPLAADVVKVNNSGGDPLVIDVARTVASFEMMPGATLSLSAPLTVASNLDLGEGTTTCSAGNALVVDASSQSYPLAFVKNFNAACNLTVVEGEVYLHGADTSRFNNVSVGGTGFLDPGSSYPLIVNGDLTIQESAAVRTAYTHIPVVVHGTATLGGRTDAAAFYNNGRLVLLGNVVEATPIAASLNHWIVLGDSTEVSPPTRTYTVTHGGTSAIDNLRIHSGQWDVAGVIRARELRMVGSSVLNDGRVVIGMQAGLGDAGVLQTSSASVITTKGFSFRGATNLANGIFAPDTADFYGQFGETPQSIRRSGSAGTNLYQLIRVFQPARMVDYDGIYSIGQGLEVLDDGVLTFGDGTNPPSLQFDAGGYLRTYGIDGRLRFVTPETDVSVDSLHIENAGPNDWSDGSIFARSVVQRDHLGTSTNLNASSGTVSFHLNGTGTVDFQSPTFSKFGSLYLVGESDVTLASDLQVTRQLARYDANDGAIVVRAPVEGSGPTPHLQVGGGTDFDYSADPVTFRNVRLDVSYIEGLGPEEFNNVTFTGMNPEVVFLTVYMTGNDTRTFANINFDSPVTTGGFFYFSPSPDSPAIEFINASPAFGCFANEPCVPGDEVPDPNVANLTWTGTADDGDWGNPANWDGAAVPSGNSQVTIPGSLATTYPTVNGSFSVGHLQIDAFASVTIETESKITVYDNLAVFGDLYGVPGSVIEMRPAGVVYLSHSGGAFEPEFRIAKGLGDIEGAVLLATNVAVEGAVDIRGGALAINGYTFTALDDFATSYDGVLMMTGVLDVLQVHGQTLFNGGSTDGYLTAGTIQAHGDFIQSNDGESDDSFAPSGSHTLAFVGGAPATIAFATPGTPTGYSKIQNLAMQKDSAVTVEFTTDAYLATLTTLDGILEVLGNYFVNVSGTAPTGSIGFIRVNNNGTFFVADCDDEAVIKISAVNLGTGVLSPAACFGSPP